jgi:RNA polymerase sigma-70 factor (ECF subfamily)
MMNPSTLHQAGDEELARRAQQGCAASLDHLLRRYQVPVLHFLQHRGAGAEADDLLQETLLRVFTHLESYRTQWPFKTWVFTIARRVSINHRRRGARLGDSSQLPEAVSDQPGPEETAAQRDGRQQLWEVAARVLSEEEHTALWLHYVESLSLSDVARVLEKSWLAVKVQVFRARRKLAPELRRLGHGPSDVAASCSRPTESRLART